MRIVSFLRIKKFSTMHPDADIALRDWYTKTKESEWNSIQDMKSTFNSVDYVGNNRYVLNIKGNKYRLVAIVIFLSQEVYIRFIGKQSEYDRIDCKNI